MYVIFRFDDGDVVCYPVSYWLISKDGDEADIYFEDDDPLEFRNNRWTYAGDLVEIIEILPDIRRFLGKDHKAERKICRSAGRFPAGGGAGRPGERG